MATTPLSDAIVSIAANNIGIGNTITDVSGNYSYEWLVTEDQYNNTASILSEASKAGYITGGNKIEPLPSFSSAVENGISLNIILEKDSGNAQFYLDRYSLYFSYGGSTVNINVTCPDNTWTVEESTSWITTQKVNQTTLSITAAAQPTSATTKRTAMITVLWNNTRLVINCEQDASQVIRSNVVFKGKISDLDTGSGVSGISVLLNGNMWPSGGLRGTTDSSGNYSITANLSDSEYSSLTASINVSATTEYSSNSKSVQKPTFSEAVSNGITTDMSLQKTATNTFYVEPTSHSFNGYGGVKSFIIYKAATDNISVTSGIEQAWANSSSTYYDIDSSLSYQLVPIDSTTVRLDITLTELSISTEQSGFTPSKTLSWTIQSGRANNLTASITISQTSNVYYKLSVTPTSINYPSAFSNDSQSLKTITVNNVGTRTWTATSNASWVSTEAFTTSPASFKLRCLPNSTTSARSTQVIVKTTSGINESVIINITQEAGGTGGGTTLTISPTTMTWRNTESGSSSAKICTVTTNATSWDYSASSDISLHFNISKSGNSLQVYPKNENTTSSAINGSITITTGLLNKTLSLTHSNR